MLTNIIDRRRQRREWQVVRASLAPLWQVGEAEAALGYEAADPPAFFAREHRRCSVADAVRWAIDQPFAAILYLDDDGTGDVVRLRAAPGGR